MWPSVSEVYPAYANLLPAPVGQVLVSEPQVVRQAEYRPVKPPEAPYELTVYSKRLWVC